VNENITAWAMEKTDRQKYGWEMDVNWHSWYIAYDICMHAVLRVCFPRPLDVYIIVDPARCLAPAAHLYVTGSAAAKDFIFIFSSAECRWRPIDAIYNVVLLSSR